jgi:hypothetical protein
MVDSQSYLVIKLEDVVFKKIMDIISAAKSNIQLTISNKSINDIWILSSSGFSLNPEFVENNCHKAETLAAHSPKAEYKETSLSKFFHRCALSPPS